MDIHTHTYTWTHTHSHTLYISYKSYSSKTGAAKDSYVETAQQIRRAISMLIYAKPRRGTSLQALRYLRRLSRPCLIRNMMSDWRQVFIESSRPGNVSTFKCYTFKHLFRMSNHHGLLLQDNWIPSGLYRLLLLFRVVRDIYIYFEVEGNWRDNFIGQVKESWLYTKQLLRQ